MQCRCGEEMRRIWCFDTGTCGHPITGKDIAHNTYACEECGAVAVENVWHHEGVRWIEPHKDDHP